MYLIYGHFARPTAAVSSSRFHSGEWINAKMGRGVERHEIKLMPHVTIIMAFSCHPLQHTHTHWASFAEGWLRGRRSSKQFKYCHTHFPTNRYNVTWFASSEVLSNPHLTHSYLDSPDKSWGFYRSARLGTRQWPYINKNMALLYQLSLLLHYFYKFHYISTQKICYE